MSDPIPMLLWCPECSERHIDEGAFATKSHHTHACQGCGHVWRPAVVPTCGVRFLPGFKNGEITLVELNKAAAQLRAEATVLREPLDLRTATPLTPQATIFQQIAVERDRQDKQWGGWSHDDKHDRKDWINFIHEHNSRAQKAVARKTGQPAPDLDEYRKQLVEVAALAVAGIEALDRRRS